jgi:hypothetical protein
LNRPSWGGSIITKNTDRYNQPSTERGEGGGLGIAHITKIFISTTKNKGREAKSNIIFVIMQKKEKNEFTSLF